MADYTLIFFITLAANVFFTFRSSELWKKLFQGGEASSSDAISTEEKARHNALLRKYLIVYLLATLSDWLQGPYVYALYDAYGYSQHDIAVLFVAGFGSSMVFGSFVGGMADWGGRRRFIIVYAITYAASCATKHFKDFNILMLGRLLGGIATSLLFSIFEAWLIRSHADAKLDKSCLSKSFSWAAYGNSVVAIVAGLVANKAANSTEMTDAAGSSEFFYVGGYLNPFDLSLIALVFCGICAAALWEENYGETSAGGKSAHWYDGLKNAYTVTIRSRDILLCGLTSSLFEGSMYIFVFMWTPALQALSEKDTTLPFGLIFSTFMVSAMAGSSIFSILVAKFKVEVMAVGVFAVSAVSMALVCIGSTDVMIFTGMLLFEVCVGMYFPIMGTMKSMIVPEDKRAAIYNLYRIPLNLIVLFSLLTDLTPTISFGLNSGMLLAATLLQMILKSRRRLQGQTSTEENTETEALVPKDDAV
mmetsp:Transcript_8926/g.13729  ORF Transcript_8926/g.13729 Transcript_8926/m.13729 type:complete len:475 (+) Transcript_8926:104-1528(+)